MDNGSVKSAARILDLLELFSSTAQALGVSAIAKRLCLPKSSAHMLLLTLEQRGFIVDDGARRFRLHTSFSPDARAWIGGVRGRLVQIAGPTMRELVDRTNETCFLSVLRIDWLIECIGKVVSSQELRIDSPIGSTREPNAGSSGLVLLAFAPEADVERFLATYPLRYTAHTISDPSRLRRELSAIRKRGYAIAERVANYSHTSGVAAPIWNPHGKVIAAISIGAPTARFSLMRDQAIEGSLRAAELLTRGLRATQLRTNGSH